jgi:peptidase M28-like protein
VPPLARVVVSLLVGAVLLVAGGSCGGGDGEAAPATATTARARGFDATRALTLLRAQVRAGPRPAGSSALRRLAVRLRDRLPAGRFEVVPGSDPARALRNVVGVVPGRLPAVLVGAHYDTQPVPRGFVGANDGAAGTAAVVELARVVRADPPVAGGREVRFVLFDGEELPAARTGSADFEADALRGSKAYARAHAGEIGDMVLLDYIAHAGVRLPREGTSTPALWSRLRAAARRVGTESVFPSGTGISITDDHTPFLRAGVRAIDLIDWDYGAKNTLRDRLDQISRRSLAAVGATVLELVRELRRG